MAKEECWCCIKWASIPSDDRLNVGTKKHPVAARVCPSTKRMMQPETPACSDFTMADKFWCYERECFTSILACIARQRKEYNPECKICSQGEKVKDMARGRRNLARQPTEKRLIA